MTSSIKSVGRYGVLASITIATLATCVGQAQATGKTKSIDTFGGMLQYWGISNPYERKYIEEETKQYLQDEISKFVDTKLDVVDYIQTLDHLANGEIKKANNYLAEKVLSKLLENVIGGPAMKVLTAAWDFDKYTWTSVQKWAEQKDKDLFHNFLLAHVTKWRQGKDLYEIDTKAGTVQAFNLWWSDNKDKLGRTKMYGDRQKYYKDFKNACLNRMMDVADRQRQAREAQAALNLAMRQKLAEIRWHIGMQRRTYTNALRTFERAKIKADYDLVKKYLSDQTYREHVNQLAAKNPVSTIEDKTHILRNAEADIATAQQAASQVKDASEKNTFRIVSLPLQTLNVFLNDYKTLMESVFSGAVDRRDAELALVNWRRKSQQFTLKIGQADSDYGKMIWIPSHVKMTPAEAASQRKQINAERERIRKALETFSKAVKEERTRREQQAVSNVGSLREHVEKLQELFETPLAADLAPKAWKWHGTIHQQLEQICNNTSVGPVASGWTTQQARAYLRGGVMRRPPEYSPSLFGAFVSQLSADPLAAMNRASTCYANCIDAYKQGLADLRRDVMNRIDTNDAMLKRRTDALLALEKAYEPLDAQTVLLKYDSIGFRYAPDYWRNELAVRIQSAEKDNFAAMKHLKSYHCQLSAMLGCQQEMRQDFNREKSLLSQAQNLLADAKALSGRYSGKGTDQPDAVPDLAIAVLRSGDSKAIFDQMVSHNHAVIQQLSPTATGYSRILGPDMLKVHRLDKPPFEGWRRYPSQNTKLVKAIQAAIEAASDAKTADAQNAPVLKKCDSLLQQLDDIASRAHLLSGLVATIDNEMREHLRHVQDALAPESRRIVRNIDADRKTLESFKAFVAQANANYAADNQTMRRYLEQAKALMAKTVSPSEDRDMRNLQQASQLLDLASLHTQVIEHYALYKGSWQFDSQIKKLRQQLGQLSSGVADAGEEPVKFRREGIFTVSVNGVSFGQIARGEVYEVTGKDGKLVIRSEACSPLFANAKKVIARIFRKSNPPAKFVTVATNQTSFAYPVTVVPGKIYTFELCVISRENVGYIPNPFPLNFRCVRSQSQTFDEPDSDDGTDMKNTLAGKDYSNALGLPLADDAQFIISLSRSILHREPSEGEVAAWVKRLSYDSRQNTYYAFFGSQEYSQRKTTSSQFVRDAFQSILGREPKPAESRVGVDYLDKGRGLRRGVLHYLLSSREYNLIQAKRTGGHDADIQEGKNSPPSMVKKHDRETDNAGSANKAYQEYMATYNRLTKLMAAGKGDTPEAQEAYKQYKAAKDKYEALRNK